jgi:hypothetical protein
MRRRTLLATAGGFALAAPAVHAQGRNAGVALVIGNSKYKWEAPLPNVRRDAPDMAKVFQGLGLKTDLVQDASLDVMRRSVDALAAAARGAPLAVLYYAGHGANWGKQTYLVPVDTDLGNPAVVQKLLPESTMRAAMEGAGSRLIVFDSCRNNPADGWRQREAVQSAAVRPQELEPQSPSTLVLFSTAPGRVALDGPPGENSPFAASFMRQFDGPSVDLQTLAPKLRRDLLIATEGRQVLWDRNTFQQPLTLAGARRGAASANRAGWSADPSRIVDIRNAYAYARESGLPLPEGLIAHRPPAGSRDATKVGAFKYTSVGNNPALIVVMSVEEQATAEVILVTRNPRDGAKFWRFVTGKLAGDGMEYLPVDSGPRAQFRWSDANSGSVTLTPPQGAGNAQPIYNTRFARLD